MTAVSDRSNTASEPSEWQKKIATGEFKNIGIKSV